MIILIVIVIATNTWRAPARWLTIADYSTGRSLVQFLDASGEYETTRIRHNDNPTDSRVKIGECVTSDSHPVHAHFIARVIFDP